MHRRFVATALIGAALNGSCAGVPREGVHGFFKSGLIVEDFDRTVSTLRTRGVEIAFGPFPKSSTQRANVIVRDNAGNLIQFFGK